MARLQLSVEIAAPADRVFAFFLPQRMVYWYGGEMETEFELLDGSAEFAVSQKVRITGRMARREVSLTAVVTRYEWLRALEWRFHDAYGVKGMQSWDVEPLAAQSPERGVSPAEQQAPANIVSDASVHRARTRVTMRDEYELPGWFGHLWDWLLMRHAVARRNRIALAKLKALSEHR